MRRNTPLAATLAAPVLLNLFPAQANAQPAAVRRSVADTAWQRLTRSPAYGYRTAVEAPLQPKPPEPSSEPGFLKLLEFLGSGTGQVLLWSFFGGLVLYGAYHLVTNRGPIRRRRATPPSEANHAVSEPLDAPDADWSVLAKQAAAAGDYRTAIRCDYRRLLGLLEQAGLIPAAAFQSDAAAWQLLRPTPYGRPFASLQHVYERVWFGTQAPTLATYTAFQAEVRQLLQSLPA